MGRTMAGILLEGKAVSCLPYPSLKHKVKTCYGTTEISGLSASHFYDEEEAYEYIEARLWPEGPVCPHCGSAERAGKLKGKSTRAGLWKCDQCRKPFTVKIGTIFEDSKVPMRLWLQAMYLMSASNNGISSNQLHRILGVNFKTALFISHRICAAILRSSISAIPTGSLLATMIPGEPARS
jgi:transposase-like protein